MRAAGVRADDSESEGHARTEPRARGSSFILHPSSFGQPRSNYVGQPVKDETPKKPSHSLADLQYGADVGHTHDGGDADHDHDDFGPDGSPENNPLWAQDHVSLTSVGIDIGSAGTQLIFSRINLRRLGEDLSSRYCVVSRETLFQSPVELTPYRDQERIEDTRLARVIM